MWYIILDLLGSYSRDFVFKRTRQSSLGIVAIIRLIRPSVTQSHFIVSKSSLLLLLLPSSVSLLSKPDS
jgi:hypothetical protein